MNNKNLRKLLKNKRKNLSQIFIKKSSQIIANKIIKLTEYQNAKNIASYISVSGESDPVFIIENAWKNNKTCYLPIVESKNNTLQFAEYNKKIELIKNKYKILEPKNSKIIDAKKLDIVIVPLVAFDENKNRLGMGGGYYDKTFSFRKNNSKKPFLIGIGYEFQKVKIFDVNSWDIKLDSVITELS